MTADAKCPSNLSFRHHTLPSWVMPTRDCQQRRIRFPNHCDVLFFELYKHSIHEAGVFVHEAVKLVVSLSSIIS